MVLEKLQHFMKWKKASSMVINKISKDNRDKVKVFLNVVEKEFSFLKGYGYKFKEAKVATEYVVKDIVEVFYKNEDLDRTIIVHYEPIDIDKNVVDLVTLHIYCRSEFITDKYKLEFDMYLEKYLSERNFDNLNYPNKNNKGSFKANMEASISGYAYFLKDVGENLINGKEWEDGLRFDWSSAEDMLYKAQKDILRDEDENDDDDET